MEQKRLVLAIALSLLVFLAWDFFFVKPQQPPPQQSQEAATEQATQSEDNTQSLPAPELTPTSSPTPDQKAATAQTPVADGQTYTVETPLFKAEISEKGAVLTQFTLKEYREEANDNAPLKTLIAEQNTLGTLQTEFVEKGVTGLEGAVFSADSASEQIIVTEGERTLSFSWRSTENIVIEKRFTFKADSYMIDHQVMVKNGSSQPFQDRLAVALVKYDESDKRVYGFQGPSGLVNGSLQQIKKKNIGKQEPLSGDIAWIAIQDRYFINSIIPTTPADHTMALAQIGEQMIVNRLVNPPTTFNPQNEKTFQYQLFFGPKSLRLLRGYNNDLAKAVNFGMFDFLAKPCLWLMNFIYDHVVSNYGIAIIILTLLTKLLLWPLGNKSYKSMGEMKKIQPLMTEIREKYKDDKKKQNEEIMALYRTYKVNPMGGCLPMVVQIPVFFALYRMLYEAIELRHAPFFGWINDLSAPDRLFDFGFSIPLMQPPYGIPVLTLLMGATMFLQQKMQPAMGDSTQAKMMMLMPIFFTVIFINFSSGLVLYWLVNNVVSIGQQFFVQRKRA